jgi:putative ABC transport system permease protein
VYEIARPREIRGRSLAIFDRTFAVTYVIEAVAVLIGLVGISAGIGTQVLARRGEFGMLRHLGVRRREIARLLAFEGAVQGALGVAGGLAVGVLVSLILIYVVNRQSFHWTMDLHVPWGALAGLTAVLVGAAAATAAISGRLAMGPDVVRAVREDW